LVPLPRIGKKTLLSVLLGTQMTVGRFRPLGFFLHCRVPGICAVKPISVFASPWSLRTIRPRAGCWRSTRTTKPRLMRSKPRRDRRPPRPAMPPRRPLLPS